MKPLKPLLLICLLFLVLSKMSKAQTGVTCSSAINLTITPEHNTGWQTTSIDTLWYDFIATNTVCNFRFYTTLVNKKCLKNIKYGSCNDMTDTHMITYENDTTFHLGFFGLITGQHYKFALIFGLSNNCNNCGNIGMYKIDFTSSTTTSSTCSADCSTVPNCEYLCNGSFEQFATPNSMGLINYACDWSSANFLGTPDLYTTLSGWPCSIPNNYVGCENVQFFGQNSYAGFTSDQSGYNEALVAPLQNTLQLNKLYKISFYLSLAESSTNNINNVGFAFANNYIPVAGWTNFGTHDPVVPVNTFSVTKNGWYGFTFNYLANGTETHFLIGAINGTYTLGTLPIGSGTCPSPSFTQEYYYIDDISVTELITATASPTAICAGNSSTLTATGATSYTWSPGALTGASVVVTPTVTTTYTVTGSNGACTNTKTISVTVNPSPSLTLNPLTLGICLGQSITVSAFGASTYSWNTGATTASISLSPTVNTTYTVTGTSSDGCKSQAIYNLNIKPLPAITVSASANPICAGKTTTLTMSAGGTFNSWSNGVFSNTTVVSPSITTTYTAYTTNFSTGCSNSAIITVTVNPFTTLVVNPSTICVGQTATLTANGATSYTWNTGQNTSSITVSPTVTTNYTVSGSSSSCSTASASLVLTVNSSFCCQMPVKTFTTGSISSQTTATSYSNVLIAINGTLTIDVPNFTFTNTNIRMAANSQIIIAPSCTVNLLGAHLFSCDNMWEGIVMGNNSRIITNRTIVPNQNPTIDDANIAIYSNASTMTTAANITLNYLQLSKNHIGVKIENYTGTTAYPFSMIAVNIQGDVSTPYSPGNTLKTYLSPTPINYPTTEYGVQLINVNAAMVGNNTSLRNAFKKLQNGVRMVNTNAHVIRCDFSDLTTSYNNKGIWAVGSYVNSNPLSNPYISSGTKYRMLVGIGANNNCTFKNLKNGIYADSCMTNYIQNNSFSDINGTGISVYRSNFSYGVKYNNNNPPNIYLADRDTTFIDNNNMQPLTAGANVMQNGIGMFDNYYMYSLVSNNTMTLNSAPGVTSEGVGIYHAANNYYSAYSTVTNTIIGKGNYGVHEVNNAYNLMNLVNVGGPRSISNNTITVKNGSGFPNLSLSAGIYSQNSPYATIKENIIDETSIGTPLLLLGILIDNGQQDYIGCNLIKNTSNSCQVNLNNISSTYRGNVMNGANTGLYLQNGTMGNLGSSTSDAGQNEWINNTFSTYVNNGTGSNIYYDGAANISNPRWSNNNGFNPLNPFNSVSATTSALGCTQYHKGGNGSLINQKDDNDGLISSIIQNNITFPNYNQGLLWEHKNGILNLLKDSLIDNTKPLFTQFKQQNNNSKTGKINTLMRSLGNYADVAQNKNSYLQSLNSIGAATNVVEQNYQTFMAEYIANVVGASNTSANSIGVMKQLAQKCPYSDGAVVYNARALLKVWGDNEAYFNACEIATTPDEKVAREMITATQDNTFTQNVLVYPNPTNGEFSIAYAFENTTNTFELYDIMGKIAFSKTLIGSTGVETVATSDLVTGIYFYKITDYTGKVAFTGKLVINK